jgi:hypothetical protein
VLAAYALNLQFCVLLDARRPDLLEQWHGIVSCVLSTNLRTRCKVLTWQELACFSAGNSRTLSEYQIWNRVQAILIGADFDDSTRITLGLHHLSGSHAAKRNCCEPRSSGSSKLLKPTPTKRNSCPRRSWTRSRSPNAIVVNSSQDDGGDSGV